MFLPTTILAQLKLGDLRDDWGQMIGLLFLITVSALVIKILWVPINAYKRYKFRKNKYRYLRNMDRYMIDIVHDLLVNSDNTLVLPVNNGLVAELRSNLVISPVSNTFLVDGLNPQIPFFLEPWASDIIREHEDLRRKFGMA